MSSLRWKALCIVLVLWSIYSSSSLVHFKNGQDNLTKETTHAFDEISAAELGTEEFSRSSDILFSIFFSFISAFFLMLSASNFANPIMSNLIFLLREFTVFAYYVIDGFISVIIIITITIIIIIFYLNIYLLHTFKFRLWLFLRHFQVKHFSH